MQTSHKNAFCDSQVTNSSGFKPEDLLFLGLMNTEAHSRLFLLFLYLKIHKLNLLQLNRVIKLESKPAAHNSYSQSNNICSGTLVVMLNWEAW